MDKGVGLIAWRERGWSCVDVRGERAKKRNSNALNEPALTKKTPDLARVLGSLAVDDPLRPDLAKLRP